MSQAVGSWSRAEQTLVDGRQASWPQYRTNRWFKVLEKLTALVRGHVPKANKAPLRVRAIGISVLNTGR